MKRSWSQEQLADFSGLNVRTIQRVESGQKASLETLKCLASVFEVDIDTLTEEITVIDKEAETWKELPWLFRVNMLGVNSRKSLTNIEIALFVFAVVNWFIQPDEIFTPIMFLSAYTVSLLTRYGDSKEVW
jgi:transcriptional regulator with XRE-family HTH domain